MTTGLFVRYQELIGLLESEANKDGVDAHVPHVDVLVPFEELHSYMDSVSAECLLNGMGTWYDNGVTENDHPLLCRVYKVVSEINLKHEEKKLKVDVDGLNFYCPDHV